ncbi:MAG: hypothetical protein AB1547_15600 [Thermodesulfobacteriota bacterium]
MKEKRDTIDPKDIHPELKRLIQQNTEPSGVPCAKVFSAIVSAGFSPKEAGLALDALELPITHCQLGLFGYQPEKKRVHPLEKVEPELKQALNQRQSDGRISCSDAWEIAQEVDVPKLHVGCACETLGIRIKPCQLGAF